MTCSQSLPENFGSVTDTMLASDEEDFEEEGVDEDDDGTTSTS